LDKLKHGFTQEQARLLVRLLDGYMTGLHDRLAENESKNGQDGGSLH
jgi:hypothetical protein